MAGRGGLLKTSTLAILGFLLPSALSAQTAPPAAGKKTEPGLPPLEESVTVAVTDVEVVVTDSKGRRIPGLKKEEFQVFEDGVPQPITNFYAVSGGKTVLPDGTSISLTSEEEKAPEVPPSLKAKYVLYVDNLNIDPLHRNRLFRSLKEFVDKTIGANAEAMVVTFNRSLKVRQKLTSDKGLVLGALEDIERISAQGNTIVSERNEALQKINDTCSFPSRP
jgi:VWFA-related protein